MWAEILPYVTGSSCENSTTWFVPLKSLIYIPVPDFLVEGALEPMKVYPGMSFGVSTWWVSESPTTSGVYYSISVSNWWWCLSSPQIFRCQNCKQSYVLGSLLLALLGVLLCRCIGCPAACTKCSWMYWLWCYSTAREYSFWFTFWDTTYLGIL